MPERDESNQSTGESNENLYPYKPISLNLRDLLSRFGTTLGSDFIPLVIEWGFKGPFWEKWSSLSWDELTAKDLKDSKGKIHVAAGAYLELLASGKRNIGVRLGPAWGRLANFDIDVPNRAITDALLNFCPQLDETLWTKGSTESGHSIWFRTGEDWPGWALCWAGITVPDIKGRPKKDKKTGEIKENDQALELRTQNGIQSVIYGLHENKKDHYCVVKDHPVMTLEWKWVEKIIKGTLGLGWRGWPEMVSGRTSRSEGRWTNSSLGYAGGLEKRLQIIEELGYEILDVEEIGRNRVKVRCPNLDNHNTAEKEGEAVIFPGTDERGDVAFKCLHKTCTNKDEELGSSFNQRETWKLQEAFISRECILYRIGKDSVHETYNSGYRFMSATKEFFNLNSMVARWKEDWPEVFLMTPLRLQKHLNELGIRVRHYAKGGNKISPMELEGKPAAAFLDQTDLIKSYLPEIQFVSPGRLPWWDKKTGRFGLMQYGYNPELKCLCLSKEELQPMTGKQGLEFLDKFLLSLWKYETPEDKSRALCMILAIAQTLGQWYADRGAFHLITADRHQAGKTLLIQCLGAIYGVEIKEQDQEEKGIGAVKERFNKTVSEGRLAFLIDNIEGLFEITLFEMLATSTSSYDFRLAYEKMQTANVNRMTFFFTGNEGFQTRTAMASRLNIIKILYQPGAIFEVKGESILAVIRDNNRVYRSAIAAVLMEYGKAGAPRKRPAEKETDFRFADYTRCNNGLLDYYGWPLLTSGLAQRQARAADPDILFAEKLFPELEEWKALEKMIVAESVASFLENESDLLPPNCAGKRMTPSILAGRISKLFRRLTLVKRPSEKEKEAFGDDYLAVNQFGPGFCHVFQDRKMHKFSYVISKSDNPPTGAEPFEP